MHLTEHFTLEDFLASETADRRGIVNVPDAQHVSNLAAMCQHILEPLWAAKGQVHVSSGYRCLELNRAIGSKDDSQHTRGEAADISTRGCSLAETFNWLRDNVPIDQLIREFPPNGWVHVSYSAHKAQRGELLLARLVDKRTVYETITEAVA